MWVGARPEPQSVIVLNPRVHHEIVLRKQLKSGVEAVVQRDGTFLFDFSSWTLAPSILIPGYEIPTVGEPYIPTAESANAEESAEGHAILRAQAMNVHQACLSTSELVVRQRTAAMGFPITSWNTHKGLDFHAPSYEEDSEDIRKLARNAINNKDLVANKDLINRRVLELDVVDHSLDSLDTILSANDPHLIQIVETVYTAACRGVEKRSGEAITLAWSACEQLLSMAWKGLLDNERFRRRMPKKRREKFRGRDYSASHILEILELFDFIDYDLYKSLDAIRKARNNWIHELKFPADFEVGQAISAVQDLLNQTKNVYLYLQSGGRGGVPQWNKWVWNQVRGSHDLLA